MTPRDAEKLILSDGWQLQEIRLTPPVHTSDKARQGHNPLSYKAKRSKGIADKMKSVRLAQIFLSEQGGKPDA